MSSGPVADHDKVDLTRLPPVSMVTGWWDLFLTEQLRDYAAIRAAGVTARLTVGPWLHGDPGEVKATTIEDIAWLDHHLNGGPPPARCAGPAVPAARRRLAGLRPVAAARHRATDYHLSASGQLNQELESGDSPPATFVYNPADPTPSAGGPLLQRPGKQTDNARSRPGRTS